MSFRMPPMPFPMPPLFNTAVKDICAINTFEKLLHILFSEVYCWHFGFITLLFSATTTDMSLYEVFNLFPRWPLVFRSFLHSACRPWCSNSRKIVWKVSGQRWNNFNAPHRDRSFVAAENNLVEKAKFLAKPPAWTAVESVNFTDFV